MKKYLLWVPVLLIILGLGITVHAEADGQWGNLTWSYNSSLSKLTISGTGAMADFSADSDDAWQGYRNNITTIEIGAGVTSIGARAFQNFTALSSVSIPSDSGLTSIGESAFINCSKLTAVGNAEKLWRSSLTSIGASAFEGCTSIINIPASKDVSFIGARAFYGCTALKGFYYSGGGGSITAVEDYTFYNCINLYTFSLGSSLTIGKSAFEGCKEFHIVSLPSSLTQIGQRAFYHCSLQSTLTIPAGVEEISAEAFRGCHGCKTLIISEGCVRIGKYAFAENANMAECRLAESVTEIGEGAFQQCTRLETCVLPDSLMGIGASAFSGCIVLNAISIPNRVTVIEDSAFADCLWLKQATISGSVKTISDGAFRNCERLEDVTLAEGLEVLGDYAFSGCSGLGGLTLPSTLKAIGTNALAGCSGTARIVLPGSLENISNEAFGSPEDAPKLVTTPNSATARILGQIGFAFWDTEGAFQLKHLVTNGKITGTVLVSTDSNLETITVPDYVTVIGSRACYDHEILTKLILPESVTAIEEKAFWYCNGLREVSFPAKLKAIGDEAFSRSGLQKITLPESLESVGEKAFSSCIVLHTAEIPESIVPALSLTAFADDGELQLDFDNCDSELFRYAKNAGISYTLDHHKSVVSHEAEEGYSAWSECKTCGEIIVPRTAIVDSEDPNAEALLGKGNGWSLTRYSGILTITKDFIPAGTTRPWYAWRDTIRSIVLEEGVTKIYDYEFADSYALPGTVTIPSTVTEIGFAAFSGCKVLAAVLLPDGISNIGQGAFNNCPAVLYASTDSTTAHELGRCGYSFRDPATNYSIRYNYAEDGKTLLETELTAVDKTAETVICPPNVTVIGPNACLACSALKRIEFPDGITSIGARAFDICDAVRIANIGSDTAVALGKAGYSFRQPDETYDFLYQFDEAGTVSGLLLFNPRNVLTEAFIPEGVTEIADNSFKNHGTLEKVIIPDSVTKIGSSAFEGCNVLKSLVLPDHISGVFSYYSFPRTTVLYAQVGSDTAITLSRSGFIFRRKGKNDSFALRHVFERDESDELRCVGLAIIRTDRGTESVVIPDEVTAIGGSAFTDNQELTSVTIPDTVVALDSGAFEGCVNLKELVLPDHIGLPIYMDCNATLYATANSTTAMSLGTKSLPFRPKGIQANYSLMHVYDGQLNYEGLELHRADRDITSFTVPKEVTIIGSSAFTQCDKLTEVIIPEGVTTIDSRAFNHQNISKVVVPRSVTEIRENAFCSGMFVTIYCYRNSFADTYAQKNNIPVVYLDEDNSQQTDEDDSQQTDEDIGQQPGTDDGQQTGEDNNQQPDKDDSQQTSEDNDQQPGKDDSQQNGEDNGQQEEPDEQKLGDIDGDRLVNGKDAIRLMKYLAGECDPETGKEYIIDKKTADLNLDGKVDELDLLRLVKYLAGEITELVPTV